MTMVVLPLASVLVLVPLFLSRVAGERFLRPAAAVLPQAVRHQVPGVYPGRLSRGAQQAGR